MNHPIPATTVHEPPSNGMSAGKNTYTYDAHTYHTKVPPQGIAELLKHYLPEGGVLLDPFAGSGMTGVASRVLGYDCILNELSPAACFIANRFISYVEPAIFEAGVNAVLNELQDLRSNLYTTICRECGRATEILYTVWSYRVLCSSCGQEFLLWDHCRKYGKRSKEHKILSEFPCPTCKQILRKSRLKRTIAEPVQLGYMCCGSRQQEVVHP
jgi:ribosomal protein S27E